MLTNIIISFVPHSGMYATVYQYADNGSIENIVQTQGSIYYVNFFHWREDKEFVDDGYFSVATNKKGYAFQMHINHIQRVPRHKSCKNAKPIESVFIVDNTLYINSDKVQLKTWYEKIDSRKPGEKANIHSLNFTLAQNFEWNHGGIFVPLLYDVHDYHDLEIEVIDAIKEIFSHGFFNSTDEIKECAQRFNKLVDNLESRLQWWEEATVETLVALYKDRRNKKEKGGEK